MCKGYNDDRICQAHHFGPKDTLALKGDAKFCLEPVGDTPFRKSFAESVSFGCIPVTFSPLSDLQVSWSAPFMNASRVAVSRRDFLAGKIDLRETLGGIPAADVRGMQAVLRAHGRGFQYSCTGQAYGHPKIGQ